MVSYRPLRTSILLTVCRPNYDSLSSVPQPSLNVGSLARLSGVSLCMTQREAVETVI